ncbi:hypothetical protein B0H11DRAFT_1918066 [Mycena galericulata]|nr:hypothetical protein B0H11DRAFT_1918066 [Mycena galericulata]
MTDASAVSAVDKFVLAPVLHVNEHTEGVKILEESRQFHGQLPPPLYGSIFQHASPLSESLDTAKNDVTFRYGSDDAVLMRTYPENGKITQLLAAIRRYSGRTRPSRELAQ